MWFENHNDLIYSTEFSDQGYQRPSADVFPDRSETWSWLSSFIGDLAHCDLLGLLVLWRAQICWSYWNLVDGTESPLIWFMTVIALYRTHLAYWHSHWHKSFLTVVILAVLKVRTQICVTIWGHCASMSNRKCQDCLYESTIVLCKKYKALFEMWKQGKLK